ncbi:MAG: helix-turn-helix domain-containing protein [Acidobacteria bacterium]|nr:helix-turn-helix domain-containing protein [Acidobacteriota bacterium]
MLEAVPKKFLKEKPRKPTVAEEVALLAADEKRELVTPALAARLLGKSTDTIYRWLNEGRLAGRKVGGTWAIYKDSVIEEWNAGRVERE